MHPDCCAQIPFTIKEFEMCNAICQDFFYLFDRRKESLDSEYIYRQNRLYDNLVENWPMLTRICGELDITIDLTLRDFDYIVNGFGIRAIFDIGYDERYANVSGGRAVVLEESRLVALALRMFGTLLTRLKKRLDRAGGTDNIAATSQGGVPFYAEEWLTVKDAAILLMNDICGLSLQLAQSRVSRAASNGEFCTNGQKGRERRIAKNSFSTWRLKQRDKDLDKET